MQFASEITKVKNMSVAMFNPSADLLKISEKAEKHFNHQLAHSDAKAIRFSVKENGCTGFSYVMDLVESPEKDDLEMVLGSDLHIFVDSTSVSILQGTEIDYVLDGVNSVVQFKNPNAKDFCGCGESFSVN